MNEEVQPSYQEGQPPTYVMPGISMTEGLLQQQIDNERIIEEIENAFLGRKLELKNNTVHLSEPNPHLRLINERGLARLSMELRARLNKVFQLSILDESSIQNLAVSFGRTINKSIFEHWDDWEIPSTSAASQITGILTDTYFSTLKKAYMGRYLRSISTTQSMQEVQTITQQQQQPKKNILSNVPVLGRVFPK